MSSIFARLHPRLQEAIVARLGWTSLRPVQQQAGEALLAGKNAVILAPTAGGKTEASIFPTLSMLLEHPTDSIGAIYIAPIKALLNNQAERLGLYTEMVGLDRQVWHGDTEQGEKKRFIREPKELLMTTPESLEVMLISPRVPAQELFADLRIIIIDEVHAMAGTDRGAHLMSVLERIAKLSRHDIQRVGLSATVGNPKAIGQWLQGSSQRQREVVDPPKKQAKRQLLITKRDSVQELAIDAARTAKGQKSLFFCQSRATSESVAGYLRQQGIDVFVHHSAVSRQERALAEANFERGADACIVCTSTLELGIDVGDLDRVMQHQAPDTVSSFLQRMGRTGRREGKPANTFFFCESSEVVPQALALIKLAKEGWVEDVDVLERCWPVFVHQILAMALASDGVPVMTLWDHLRSVPDFSGIRKEEFDAQIAFMLQEGWLTKASGRLILGPKSERRFGRRNFMELYAVFKSPQQYTVSHGERSVGTLQQDFVDGLVEDISAFLLGGRAWQVRFINHKERQIKVEPAPRGKKPTWGGHTPQFLSFHLCQAICDILGSDEDYSYLHESARTCLVNLREDFRGLLPRAHQSVLEVEEDEVRWWTFAGGKVNTTLKYAIEAKSSCKAIPDNLLLRIRGEQARGKALRDLFAKLKSPGLWSDQQLWTAIRSSLPNYRLSKFQDALPPSAQGEMIGDFLLDIERATRIAAGVEDP